MRDGKKCSLLRNLIILVMMLGSVGKKNDSNVTLKL